LSLSSLAAAAEPWRERTPATEERYLDIPGLGHVPIPLPPGTRVFGPQRGSPRSIEPPALEQRGERRPETVESLFIRLAGADSAEEAAGIAQAIGRLWARSGSPTVDLLLARAIVAGGAGEHRLALELYDRVVALRPSWPEALVGRAKARARVGDDHGAEQDLDAAVALEPRRFDALGALGALLERVGERARALEAYRRALTLDPWREDWRKAEERLGLEIEGRDI
jgi:tetratricopeptide (TPR) repeat protein